MDCTLAKMQRSLNFNNGAGQLLEVTVVRDIDAWCVGAEDE